MDVASGPPDLDDATLMRLWLRRFVGQRPWEELGGCEVRLAFPRGMASKMGVGHPEFPTVLWCSPWFPRKRVSKARLRKALDAISLMSTRWISRSAERATTGGLRRFVLLRPAVRPSSSPSRSRDRGTTRLDWQGRVDRRESALDQGSTEFDDAAPRDRKSVKIRAVSSAIPAAAATTRRRQDATMSPSDVYRRRRSNSKFLALGVQGT